jgi:proteasome lid subunit RPN8/RPN11
LRHITIKLLAYENTRRSTMRQDVGETREVSRLELWRRASRWGDLEAWAAFQQSLEETVLTWFHAHPSCEAASRVQSESHFVARAFEQLWHLVVQGQVAGETLSEALVSLRASLNGAILETLRASRRPGAASSSWLDGEECPETSEIWNSLQAELPDQREQRLAYLLYHCGLQPSEIVRCCPQEWSDVHEVARLRRSILMRLMQRSVLAPTEWRGEIPPASTPPAQKDVRE